MIMSVPRRHHYVPRVHIRHFKSQHGYYLLLKDNKSLKNPKSSKDIFVKKDLNTSGKEDGVKDFDSLEKELTKTWDNQYNHFLKDIELNLNSPTEIKKETLDFFFEYCLIGRMRNAKLNLKIDDIVDPFKEGLPDFIEMLESEEIKNEFTQEQINAVKVNFKSFNDSLNLFEKIQRQVKYSAPIPSELKMLLPSACYCVLFHSKSKSFILPDSTGIVYKSNQTFDLNGVSYNKISMIGIPLTPNLFLEIRNCDIYEEEKNSIYRPDKGRVNIINQKLFEFSNSQVLLSNKSLIGDLKG